MKSKSLSISLLLVLVFGLISCSSDKDSGNESETKVDTWKKPDLIIVPSNEKNNANSIRLSNPHLSDLVEFRNPENGEIDINITKIYTRSICNLSDSTYEKETQFNSSNFLVLSSLPKQIVEIKNKEYLPQTNCRVHITISNKTGSTKQYSLSNIQLIDMLREQLWENQNANQDKNIFHSQRHLWTLPKSLVKNPSHVTIDCSIWSQTVQWSGKHEINLSELLNPQSLAQNPLPLGRKNLLCQTLILQNDTLLAVGSEFDYQLPKPRLNVSFDSDFHILFRSKLGVVKLGRIYVENPNTYPIYIAQKTNEPSPVIHIKDPLGDFPLEFLKHKVSYEISPSRSWESVSNKSGSFAVAKIEPLESTVIDVKIVPPKKVSRKARRNDHVCGIFQFLGSKPITLYHASISDDENKFEFSKIQLTTNFGKQFQLKNGGLTGDPDCSMD